MTPPKARRLTATPSAVLFKRWYRGRRRGRHAAARSDGAGDRHARRAGRRSAWCCIAASAAAVSCSTRTTTAARPRELFENPRAAFVFHWPLIERQVRGEGRVEKLSRAESDRYFQSRPRESRLSAWASPQSARDSGSRVSRGGIRARVNRDLPKGKSRARRSGGVSDIVDKLYRVLAGAAASAARSRPLRKKGRAGPVSGSAP